MEKIPFNLKEGFNGNLGWILAGGSAFKGEDKFTCIKKELFEETGIISENFKELEIFISDDDNCIFYTFSCATDWDKTSVKLQDGETISYK